MTRDYDWDLESPVDDPLSVDRNIGPKYRDELGDLYRLFQVPTNVDSEFDPSRDSERIQEWEQMVDLATYQFQSVPDVVEADQERAEKMFDTGEVLVYNLLDDFSDLHADYYSRFTSKRYNVEIDELKDSYEEAYDTVENMDDRDFSNDDIRTAGDEGIGGSAGGNPAGSMGDSDIGGDIGGGDL